MTYLTTDPEMRARRIYKSLPRGFGEALYQEALASGMIAKENLEHNQVYVGWCRNTTEARWDQVRNVFMYRRTKFGASFEEDIRHPENDDGFDVFVPVEKRV